MEIEELMILKETFNNI